MTPADRVIFADFALSEQHVKELTVDMNLLEICLAVLL